MGVHTHVRQLRRYLERSGTPARLLHLSRGGDRLLSRFRPPLPHTGAMQPACQRCLVFVLASGFFPQSTAPAPRRCRGLRRLRPGSPGRPSGAARPARAAPVRGYGSSPSDVHGRTNGPAKSRSAADGTVFRAIRQLERRSIPQVDGLVYVSKWHGARSWASFQKPGRCPPPSSAISWRPCRPGPAGSRSEIWLRSVILILSRTTVSSCRFWLKPSRRENPSPSIFSARGRAGKTSCGRLAPRHGRAGPLSWFRSDVRDFLPGYRAQISGSWWGRVSGDVGFLCARLCCIIVKSGVGCWHAGSDAGDAG